MYGSEIASEALVAGLSALPAVATAIGDRIVAGTLLPQDMALPAALVTIEAGDYDTGIGQRVAGPLTYEQVRAVVRLICEGHSSDPIYAAAEAQLAAFDGLRLDVEHRGRRYLLVFTAAGEVVPPQVADDAGTYRQLGTVYQIEITTGD